MLLRLYVLLCAILCGPVLLPAQRSLPVYPDSLFSTYYHQRRTLFEALPQTKGDILFVGNSITDGAEWAELFNDLRIKNRGICGDITAGVLRRSTELANRKPAKIFLMIGVNDLARGTGTDSIVNTILRFADWIKEASPSTKLYVQSLLPVSDRYGKFSGHTNKTDSILKTNAALSLAAADHQFTVINLYTAFCDATGRLDAKYTNDGLHLAGEGYMLWKHLVYPYVFDLQDKPSLLPLPLHITWTEDNFSLYKGGVICINDTSLNKEAAQLQSLIQQKGWIYQVTNKQTLADRSIVLELLPAKNDNNTEAYTLSVTADRIVIGSANRHGLFNGIQTLRQLMRDGVIVDGCNITDKPAFSWRGYMVDVGRNYMPLDLLKEQIDIMAAYKLNVFHLHLTEDIAWRLQSKKYPQLTDAQYMQRNPGEFYSVSELHALIDYCKERYITLVPEIDMPGHSAAFKRATGVDMQSDSGMVICRKILEEFCDEFDVPFIHIGGDEVKISNRRFLPEMSAVLRSRGKKVIGWDPGGNMPAGSYLQLWNGNSVPKPGNPAIDSRHLYLNHFDPLEGVSATFNHIVCDTPMETVDRKGATLCLWPDRRVSRSYDMIKMNAVYPVMLAFAERCWLGGGYTNFSSVISHQSKKDFAAFELRLTDQGKTIFSKLPFPYTTQSGIEWKLIGPFKNGGNTAAVFAPELPAFMDTVKMENYPSVTGATIWLRHFWHPMIQSHLSNPEENTTWYAIRKIWVNEEGEKEVWISFNDLSRSPATDSPPVGAWDNRSSAVWVNGTIVQPPQWKRGGQPGNMEIPLVDEGYAYRAPHRIYFRKGWNTVLIKAPVGSFKAAWQQPVKWMFVFAILP